MTELINFIKHYQDLDFNTEKAILESFTLEKVEKNEFVAERGKICSKIGFIKSGLVRRYYVDEEKETTIWLYHDNHWISSLASYFLQKPSLEYLQACEETILYTLTFENEQKLLEFPQFKDFHIKFLRSSLAAFDEQTEDQECLRWLEHRTWSEEEGNLRMKNGHRQKIS
jgi:hypothetical protein